MRVSLTDKVSGMIGASIGAVMYWYAGTFPERAASAALYVRFLAVVMGIFSLLVFIRAFLVRDNRPILWIERPVFFYLTAGLLILYVAFLSVLGFFIASFLFMFGLSWILGYRKLVSLVLGTVSLLAVIYFVFIQFLSVPVPAGIF